MQLDRIVSILADWAAEHPLVGKAWVFGSRARHEERHDSDVDIAIELDLSAAGGADESGGLATWMYECGSWDSELGAVLPLQVDLEQFVGARTPIIKTAINRSSVLAYKKQGFRGKPVKISARVHGKD